MAFKMGELLDPKTERNLYFVLIATLALYAIPYTHDMLAKIFEYEIVGNITVGILIGCFALYETFIRLRNHKFG